MSGDDTELLDYYDADDSMEEFLRGTEGAQLSKEAADKLRAVLTQLKAKTPVPRSDAAPVEVELSDKEKLEHAMAQVKEAQRVAETLAEANAVLEAGNQALNKQVGIQAERILSLEKVPPTPKVTNGAKLASPNTFSGDGTIHVRDWLAEMFSYLEYHSTPVERQVQVAQSYLKGKTRVLCENIKKRQPNSVITWEWFSQEMIRTHGHINPELKARLLLDNCKQGDSTVEKYMHRFLSIVSDI